MQVSVQRASPTDLDELYEIELECFGSDAYTRTQISTLIKNLGSVSLLATVSGKTVGFVIGVVERDSGHTFGHIITIDVSRNYRRRRVGSKLLREAEQAFLRAGAEASILEVRTDNEAARRLYQNEGYHEIEALNNYYSKRVHGLRLGKLLKPKT